MWSYQVALLPDELILDLFHGSGVVSIEPPLQSGVIDDEDEGRDHQNKGAQQRNRERPQPSSIAVIEAN